jgi:hypothetical protein
MASDADETTVVARHPLAVIVVSQDLLLRSLASGVQFAALAQHSSWLE